MNPQINVSVFTTFLIGQPLALQSEDLIGLGARGYLDLGMTAERWHGDLGTQYGVGDIYRFNPPEARAVPLKTRIGIGGDNDEQVPTSIPIIAITRLSR